MSLTNAQYASPDIVESYIVAQGGKIISRYQSKFVDGSFKTQYTIEFTSSVDGRTRQSILAPSGLSTAPFYWVVIPS
jgi:hypothetical protein